MHWLDAETLHDSGLVSKSLTSTYYPEEVGVQEVLPPQKKIYMVQSAIKLEEQDLKQYHAGLDGLEYFNKNCTICDTPAFVIFAEPK